MLFQIESHCRVFLWVFVVVFLILFYTGSLEPPLNHTYKFTIKCELDLRQSCGHKSQGYVAISHRHVKS